jgi:His-Xaa-Ser system protein HxsD
MEAIGRQEEADRVPNQPALAGDVIGTVSPIATWAGADRAALRLDLSIYTIEAALRAAYKFTDRSYVYAARDTEAPGVLVVVLTAKAAGTDLSPILGDFLNELLDQRLRCSLDAEFGALRTLIVAQAFSEGNLLDSARPDEGS